MCFFYTSLGVLHLFVIACCVASCNLIVFPTRTTISNKGCVARNHSAVVTAGLLESDVNTLTDKPSTDPVVQTEEKQVAETTLIHGSSTTLVKPMK